MKTITVRVTKKDIEGGEPGMGTRCPIAKAVQKQTNRKCAVGEDCVLFRDRRSGYREIVSLPARARRFILRFDRDHPVRPFSFKLRVPDEVLS